MPSRTWNIAGQKSGVNTFELSGGEMMWEYILGLLFDTFELPPQQRIKVTSVCFLAKLIALYNATLVLEN